VIRLPLEIIKSRTQIGAYGPDTTLRKSLRMVWKNEGLKGFWRGYGGTLGRDVSQVAVYKRLSGKLINGELIDSIYDHSIPVVRIPSGGLRQGVPEWRWARPNSDPFGNRR
jgi:hypothetical protein